MNQGIAVVLLSDLSVLTNFLDEFVGIGQILLQGLNLGDGKPAYEVSGSFDVASGRKKQWLQLGFDPYALRVQLHLLAAPDGKGYHVIHTRVTPPPPCLLTITFKAKKGGCDALNSGAGMQMRGPASVTINRGPSSFFGGRRHVHASTP